MPLTKLVPINKWMPFNIIAVGYKKSTNSTFFKGFKPTPRFNNSAFRMPKRYFSDQAKSRDTATAQLPKPDHKSFSEKIKGPVIDHLAESIALAIIGAGGIIFYVGNSVLDWCTKKWFRDIEFSFLDNPKIKEHFPPQLPSTQVTIKDNYMEKNYNVIKEQVLALKHIREDIFQIGTDSITYDTTSGDPKIIIYFHFTVNGKDYPFRHYYYLSEHPNLEVLENAINADLAFKEFFTLYPWVIVRTHQPRNILLLSEKGFLNLYNIQKGEASALHMDNYWDGKSINVGKIRRVLKEINNKAADQIYGEKWTPSLRVHLPIFKATPLTKCPEIVDLISGRSWKENSPVSIQDLAYLRIAYWDFNGMLQVGELVVHQDLATEVLEIFHELYQNHFPLKSVKLIDRYFEPNERYSKTMVPSIIDERSMRDNNTSALFVRHKTNGKSWSNHSTGRAVDVNPLVNPYVQYVDNSFKDHKAVSPAEGERFVRREPVEKGMVDANTITAFKKKGWFWGGDWNDPDNVRDYQHFSKEERNALNNESLPSKVL